MLQSVPMQLCMPCPVCSVTGPKVGNPRPQAQPLPPTLAHRKTCQIRDDNLRLFPWQLGVATCAHRVHGAMQGWSTSCKRRLQQGDPQSRQWRGDCQAGRGPPLPHLPPPPSSPHPCSYACPSAHNPFPCRTSWARSWTSVGRPPASAPGDPGPRERQGRSRRTFSAKPQAVPRLSRLTEICSSGQGDGQHLFRTNKRVILNQVCKHGVPMALEGGGWGSLPTSTPPAFLSQGRLTNPPWKTQSPSLPPRPPAQTVPANPALSC